MDEIFEQFARGEVPTVLQVLAALNEVSDMWPGDDCLDCQLESSEFQEEKPDKNKAATNTHQNGRER